VDVQDGIVGSWGRVANTGHLVGDWSSTRARWTGSIDSKQQRLPLPALANLVDLGQDSAVAIQQTHPQLS
jgi:hypothetical protein